MTAEFDLRDWNERMTTEHFVDLVNSIQRRTGEKPKLVVMTEAQLDELTGDFALAFGENPLGKLTEFYGVALKQGVQTYPPVGM
jgi:hypothetical protein